MALLVKTYAEVTIAVTNTAVPLSAVSGYVYSVSIEALSSNTGSLYLGDSTVTSSNGIPVNPGDFAAVEPPGTSTMGEQFDLNKVYVNGTAGDKCRVIAWIRE